MKVSIKKAGVLFAILTIVVLAVASVFVGVNYSNSSKVDINASSDVEQVAEQTPEIILITDDEGTIAEKWSKAVKLSIDENREVFVQLGQDWVASYTAKGTSFGFATGFVEGLLSINSNTNIKLDLNGFKIDRSGGNIMTAYGQVFSVNGKMTLMDNAFEKQRQEIYDAYDNSVDGYVDFEKLKIGRITGGCGDIGSGICVRGGTFIMESGMICQNIAISGGGIYVADDAKVTIKDGIICNNIASNPYSSGGGIFVRGMGVEFEFQNGIVYNNSALCNDTKTYSGGGGITFVEVSKANITGGIFAKNKARNVYNNSYGGAISIENENSIVNITGARFEYNHSDLKGGAIAAMKGELNISNVVISNNIARDGAGLYVMISECDMRNSIVTNNTAVTGGGGVTNDRANYFGVGSGTLIYDNYLTDSTESNLSCLGICKFRIIEKLERTRVGIKDCNLNIPISIDYSTHNGSTDPKNYFFSDVEGQLISLNSAGELQLSATIKSNVYDFVYLDSNVRKNYKDNGITYGNNDFALKQTFNSGKLVLGKIAPNTSVNEFIGNLDYGNAKIKLFDNKGNTVYGEGADSKYAGLLSDKMEFPVGTGWRLQVFTPGNVLIDDMYLSVLGDLTGDGKVNSQDVNYLRRVIADKSINTMTDKPYLQLAMLINNKNGLTNSDSNILWNIICGVESVNSFM